MESSSVSGGGAPHGDVSQSVSQFVDKHMMLRLVQFLRQTKSYSEEDIVKAEKELVASTNLFSRKVELGYPQSEVDVKSEEFQKQVQELRGQCEALLNVLESEETMEDLKEGKNFNIESLSKNFGVQPEELVPLLSLARATYESGDYAKALSLLDAYRTLSPASERDQQAAWGKLAAHIMSEDDEGAAIALSQLKSQVDAITPANTMNAVEQRVWLLHWALFALFTPGNSSSGPVQFADTFFFVQQDRDRPSPPHYLEAASLRAPYLYRYATAALVLSKRKKHLDKLIKMLELERYQHSDPITRTLEKLFIHHDFEGALEELEAAHVILTHDFFLHSFADEFRNCALMLLFEAFCQVHQSIDTKFVADKLKMDPASAELWIVNLIRSCHLDAKIDSETETIVLRRNYPSVYQQVFEKTKGMFFRSYLLSNNIDKSQQRLAQEAQQPRRKNFH